MTFDHNKQEGVEVGVGVLVEVGVGVLVEVGVGVLVEEGEKKLTAALHVFAISCTPRTVRGE